MRPERSAPVGTGCGRGGGGLRGGGEVGNLSKAAMAPSFGLCSLTGVGCCVASLSELEHFQQGVSIIRFIFW